jgi:serine/threonine-protein kinase HipA
MKERYCLCCQEKLEGQGNEEYHPSCAKKLFGGLFVPTLALDNNVLLALAKRSVLEGKTVTGVQKKLSLGLSHHKENGHYRFTLVGYPLGYILKPADKAYPDMPESEALVMELAEEVGIPVAPHGLVRLNDGSLAYITKRIDRRKDKDNHWHAIPMEDFCQLSEKPESEKYHGSYESIGRLIDLYSSQSELDKTDLFIRLVFSFLSLNSDMHLKNFSLIRNEQGYYVLSKAYDLLPTNLLLKEDEEETALTLHGKKKGLVRKDFLSLGGSLGINEKTSSALIDHLLGFEPLFEAKTKTSFLSEKNKKEFGRLFKERFERLRKSKKD